MARNTRAVTTTASAATITPTEEAVAALLSVLRSVDREVQTSLELSPEAVRAVQRFRDIAFDLATVATSGFGPGTGSAVATGERT